LGKACGTLVLIPFPDGRLLAIQTGKIPSIKQLCCNQIALKVREEVGKVTLVSALGKPRGTCHPGKGRAAQAAIKFVRSAEVG
jgi:hypothetical protein